MRRFLLMSAFVVFTLPVFGQGAAAIEGYCSLGGTPAKVQGTQSTNTLLGIVPSCAVTVYLTGTQTKATIFADASGTSLSNPFTANAINSVNPGGWIFWAAINTGYDIVLSGGIPPNTYVTPVTLTDRYPNFEFTGGGSIPAVTEILSGNSGGGAAGMAEKGTNVSGSNAWVAWNEDNGLDGAHGGGLGLFDCRDTKYPGGGCLGSTPGLAMQALANDITCYQAMTGLRANVIFPPGTISIGTAANPTLTFPTGAHYASSAPNPNGTTTTFQATYNGHLALHFTTAVSATCSDGNTHTNTLTNGYYGGGIGVHGCAQGGCTNVPGDTNGYPNGGQNQNGILIEDSGGLVDMIGAYENGGDGVNVAGESTHVGTVWTASNMAWYYFGIQQSGQTYNPTTDTWHCNVDLNSLDGVFPGPFETGGFLQTPGAEYGHVCGVFWGGGNSHMGPCLQQPRRGWLSTTFRQQQWPRSRWALRCADGRRHHRRAAAATLSLPLTTAAHAPASRRLAPAPFLVRGFHLWDQE